MNPLFAVLFLAVAVHANPHNLPDHMHKIVTTDGEQYKLYDTYTKSITLSAAHQRETFEGLNILRNDDKIDKQDLDLHYWHDEVKFAVKKFQTFVDDNNDGQIKLEELNNEFKEKPVRVALIECSYLKSQGLRKSCFADQMLTYASLVLDANDVKSFHEYIGGTDGISKSEAEKIEHVKNKDKKATAEELGAYFGNDGVSKAEFEDYVTQESINDDFRRCRSIVPDVTTGNVDFNNDCLKEELVEYTNDDLTDMDIAVMYRAVDIDGKDGISKAEIEQLPGVKGTADCDKKAGKIMKLLDMSLTTPAGTEPVVEFGEFRSYMRTSTVLIQAERECTEPKNNQIDELNCLYDLFINLVLHEHDAIWLVVPDLEQQIAFEILDTNNDGEISATELTFADSKAEDRFMKELDHDKSQYVCLEEWNEYMDIPHMVYGTGDCLLKHRTKEGRGNCYPHEVEDIMDNIKHFEDEFWTKWFQFYDSNNDKTITRIDNNEAVHKFGSQDLEDLFLSELGQGDDTVTRFEFGWYVKQQELADRFEAIVTAGNKEKIEEFHKVLLNWISNDITEYDIERFYDGLDTDRNHELGQKDFGEKLWPKMKELLKKIDAVEPNGDADETVNFREFWLWLQVETHTGKAHKTYVKDVFEDECTKKISGKNQQKQEIECYVKYFKEHPDELAKLC